MGRALPEVWSALAGDSGPQGAPCSRSRRTVSLITSPAITLTRRRGNWSGCGSVPSPRRPGSSAAPGRKRSGATFQGGKAGNTTTMRAVELLPALPYSVCASTACSQRLREEPFCADASRSQLPSGVLYIPSYLLSTGVCLQRVSSSPASICALDAGVRVTVTSR